MLIFFFECEKFYNKKFDIFGYLYCKSPIIDVNDIYKSKDLYNKSNVDTIFSVYLARKNLYFYMF